jgi:hypothetical protein
MPYTQGMKSKVVLLLLVAAPLTTWIAAQTNPIIDVFMRSRDQAFRDFIMLQQLKLQQEQLQEIQRQGGELDKIRAEADRMRREAERLESPRKTSFSDEQTKIEQEIVKALGELKLRYPDFELYESRIALVADHFALVGNSPLSIKSYIEGLYVIAKYADFFMPAHVGPRPPSALLGRRPTTPGSQPIELDFSIRPEHFQKLSSRR